jgi:hypothetical protein
MNELPLHPPWRQAVKDTLERLDQEPEPFFTDHELAVWFGHELDSNDYRLAYLAWSGALRKRNVFLVRLRHEPKGYKVANASERVNGVADGYRARQHAAIRNEILCLGGTPDEELSVEDRELRDCKMTRAGAILAVLSPLAVKRLSAPPPAVERPVTTFDFFLEGDDATD